MGPEPCRRVVRVRDIGGGAGVGKAHAPRNHCREKTMIVTRSDLELLIQEVRPEVAALKLCLYGSGSISWQVDKEIILYVGGGEAALLQLAHPYVAHAVDQHSAARRDTLGRFQR